MLLIFSFFLDLSDSLVSMFAMLQSHIYTTKVFLKLMSEKLKWEAIKIYGLSGQPPEFEVCVETSGDFDEVINFYTGTPYHIVGLNLRSKQPQLIIPSMFSRNIAQEHVKTVYTHKILVFLLFWSKILLTYFSITIFGSFIRFLLKILTTKFVNCPTTIVWLH